MKWQGILQLTDKAEFNINCLWYESWRSIHRYIGNTLQKTYQTFFTRNNLHTEFGIFLFEREVVVTNLPLTVDFVLNEYREIGI